VMNFIGVMIVIVNNAHVLKNLEIKFVLDMELVTVMVPVLVP